MNRRLFASLVAAGLAFAHAAHADQLADIKQKGQIVIGVLGTDEPNSFLDPKTRKNLEAAISSPLNKLSEMRNARLAWEPNHRIDTYVPAIPTRFALAMGEARVPGEGARAAAAGPDGGSQSQCDECGLDPVRGRGCAGGRGRLARAELG